MCQEKISFGFRSKYTNDSLLLLSLERVALVTFSRVTPFQSFSQCNEFFRLFLNFILTLLTSKVSPVGKCVCKPRCVIKAKKIFYTAYSVIDITELPSTKRAAARPILLRQFDFLDHDRLCQTPGNHCEDHGESISSVQKKTGASSKIHFACFVLRR